MRKNVLTGWVAAMLAFGGVRSVAAYEEAFPQTAAGRTELKTLPAGTLLKASAPGKYFEQSNRLFRPLFRYISERKIAMTVPVEARVDGAEMYFWVGRNEASKVNGNAPGVEVVKIPERLVASAGARGGYSESNFEATRAELLRWVQSQSGLEVAGPAYAVYWNGPFTPWFLRRYEVHVPVKRKRG